MEKIVMVWKNKWHILTGIWNTLFKRDPIERMAADRLEICASCHDIDLSGNKCMVPATNPCCGKCGCSLALKLRDPSSSCGNEEAPLWEAIN